MAEGTDRKGGEMKREYSFFEKIVNFILECLCKIGIHYDCRKTEGYQMYCFNCGSYWQYSHRYKIILLGKKGKFDI